MLNWIIQFRLTSTTIGPYMITGSNFVSHLLGRQRWRGLGRFCERSFRKCWRQKWSRCHIRWIGQIRGCVRCRWLNYYQGCCTIRVTSTVCTFDAQALTKRDVKRLTMILKVLFFISFSKFSSRHWDERRVIRFFRQRQMKNSQHTLTVLSCCREIGAQRTKHPFPLIVGSADFFVNG